MTVKIGPILLKLRDLYFLMLTESQNLDKVESVFKPGFVSWIHHASWARLGLKGHYLGACEMAWNERSLCSFMVFALSSGVPHFTSLELR